MKIVDLLKKTKIYNLYTKLRDLIFDFEDSFISFEPIEGDYHKFVYYKDKNHPRFYWAKEKVNYEKIEKDYKFRRYLFVLSIIFSLFLIRISFYIPTKIQEAANTNCIIKDTLDCLNDKEEEILISKMNKFRNKTGITPALITVYDGDWFHNYHSLDLFCSEKYKELFSDERHFLIVYSFNNNNTYSSKKVSIYIGEECKSLIDSEKATKFLEDMNGEIKDNPYFYIRDALEKYLDLFYKDLIWIKLQSILPLIIAVLLPIGMYFYFYEMKYKKDKYKDIKYSVLCDIDDNDILEGICLDCGGVYIFDVHNICPHCGRYIPSFLQSEIDNFHNVV